MAKYEALFLEEATEHLAEMSSALLELEKDSASVESIDLVFRMAHSIKSMAASVGYDGITEVSHVLEDRMERIRAAGRVETGPELTLLFHGLEGLEQMVETVRAGGDAPPTEPGLVAMLSLPPAALPADPLADPGGPPEKKART
jgi:two-component system chemotaxis sensor kinase CheA